MSANVAVYRDGALENHKPPLFTISLPNKMADVPSENFAMIGPWPATMELDQGKEAQAIFLHDRKLCVYLIDATLTTLIDLSRDPKALSIPLEKHTPVIMDYIQE